MRSRSACRLARHVAPWTIACLAALSGTVAAQTVTPDRMSAVTRATLDRLIDSARAIGLPTAPLVDKIAEGTLKGADDERIVRAVRTLSRELGDARAALGSSSDVSVLGAAASALHAGVPEADLRRMARAGGNPDPAALASALVTLVDLVAKRVPVAPATRSVAELLTRRATERQFATLRTEVGNDIAAGRSPEQSLIARATAQLRTLDPASLDVMPRRPPVDP